MRNARLLPASPSMHCVGGSAPGGCLLPGGVCSRGVSTPGGVSAPEGGCIPACTEADLPREQND